MSAKKLRIEKMKLEIKKLEAERDGLRKVRYSRDERGHVRHFTCLDRTHWKYRSVVRLS